MGSRFGVPAAEIARRLAVGRFRVKSNIDLQTAIEFRKELEKLGVTCQIVDVISGKPLADCPCAKRMGLGY